MATLLGWTILLFGAQGMAAESEQPIYKATGSAIEAQDLIDAELSAEAELGYTFEEPLCVVNPYGNVPLSALIIFDTAEATAVSMTVKGHDAADDVKAEFPVATRHILPVVGLYANENNTVELTLADGGTTTVIIQTEAIDDETLLKGEVTVPAGETFDTSKLTFVSMGNTTSITAYDSKGDLRYYGKFQAKRTTPLRQLANGHYLVASDNTGEETEANGGIMEIDLCGRIYRQYNLPGGFHHEILVMPNGNYMISTSQDDLTMLMDKVVEIDHETGDIVWELDLSDILDSTDGSSMLTKEKDWAHNNAISYDEATDSLMLSCRGIDAVICVDKSDKTIRWILGNPDGWNTTDQSLFLTPAEGQADFEWNYAQHDAQFVDSTHITMFDNGTYRYKKSTPEGERNTAFYSRAVMYSIDLENRTVTQEWSYGKDRGLEWYSSHFCSVDYDTDLDEYWICSGTTQYDPTSDAYIADASTLADSSAVQTLAKIDLVQGSELLYEMVVKGAAYRLARLAPYAYAAQVDFSTPGVSYSYATAE